MVEAVLAIAASNFPEISQDSVRRCDGSSHQLDLIPLSFCPQPSYRCNRI
jgi:hypothetical protein